MSKVSITHIIEDAAQVADDVVEILPQSALPKVVVILVEHLEQLLGSDLPRLHTPPPAPETPPEEDLRKKVIELEAKLHELAGRPGV
jgi:hypothetical protein